MRFRFFIDQCVPHEVVLALRSHEHETLLLRDHLPIRSPDHVVLAKAQELNCALLSLDGDFADIVSYPPAGSAGIVAIQIHNHPEIISQILASFVRFLATQSGEHFLRGKLFIVEAHRIRVRQS